MKTTAIHTRLIPFLFLVAALGCKQDQSGASAATRSSGDPRIIVTAEQYSSNGMSLGQPELRAFPYTLEVSGTIDVPPENRVVVSAVSGGFVKEITLLVGDSVRQGQLIVTLESPEFLRLQQQYLEAREQLPFLEAEYNRQKTMYEEQISSEKLFLQAESEYRITLAQYRSLEQQLALLNIPVERVASGNLTSQSPVYAPIPGSITRVNVRKGVYVSPATEIVEIVNDSHLHLELNVYEKDIARLKKDQLIRFQLPEYSREVYLARVYLIGTSIAEDRTVKVHAHLEGDVETGFLVGMYVRATIEVEGEETDGTEDQLLALPESAVVISQGQPYVLLLDRQETERYLFRQIPVETGRTYGGYTSVSGPDLDASSQVLVQGAFNLIGSE